MNSFTRFLETSFPTSEASYERSFSPPCVDDSHSFRMARVLECSVKSVSQQTITPHKLIMSLRHDREIDNTLRIHLIHMVDMTAYPNKRRTIIEQENWDSIIPPKRIKIDSRAKHCNGCGRSAYYIVNETTMIYAWRLCWNCLSLSDRVMMEQFYWNSSLEPVSTGYERRVQETSSIK